MPIERDLPEQPAMSLAQEVTSSYLGSKHVVVKANDSQRVNYDIPSGELFPSLTDEYRAKQKLESKTPEEPALEKII